MYKLVCVRAVWSCGAAVTPVFSFWAARPSGDATLSINGESPFRSETIGQNTPRTPKRDKQRFERQIQALSGTSPYSRAVIAALRTRRGAIFRLPLAILLLLGGLMAFLPLFGLWMIPLGLLLLAIDLPILQPVVSATIIRLRRRWAALRRWWRRSSKR